MNAPLKFVTIGVYSSDEAAFFGALQKAGVDTFCDIRWRRGLRGSEYAFANSKRLQMRLSEIGIRYLHFRDLAPSPALRNAEAAADKAQGIAKRQRTTLSKEFIDGYQRECLDSFETRKFLERLGPEARVVALFCVEREPAACHRSLLAERLQADGIEVGHIRSGDES
jgi:uncharacterized protein (DUF488 family)